jgi:hypothetical protein
MTTLGVPVSQQYATINAGRMGVEAVHVKQRTSDGPGYSAAWSGRLQTETGGWVAAKRGS